MLVLSHVLGLDLGSHSIKGVELQQGLRGLQALQLQGLERDDAQIAPAELVQRFLRLYRFHTGHVVAALPGDRLSARRLRFPFRDRRQLAQAVPFEVADDLPFEPEELVIDWQLVGGERARAEVMAPLAPRAAVAGGKDSGTAAGGSTRGPCGSSRRRCCETRPSPSTCSTTPGTATRALGRTASTCSPTDRPRSSCSSRGARRPLRRGPICR